jgi:predicted  nucleic acid-binding Zn-ribbon protein
MYCPECGTRIFHYFPREQWEATYSEAWLKIKNDDKADYICE